MTNHVEFPGLGLSFTLNRVAFTLFGMPVYWYGILIASGLLLALLFAFWKARSYGIDADRMVDVIFGATVCAIIGGRAYYVATAPFEYESFAQMLDIRLGGVGAHVFIRPIILSLVKEDFGSTFIWRLQKRSSPFLYFTIQFYQVAK